MACERPIPAFRLANGGPVTFKRPQSHTYIELEIPCGTCILCRLEHARQWAVRITHEAQLWEESSFLTLTYADEHLPMYNSLDYSHLQTFWKRLRKQIGKLRYYAVGEYGDETKRPHYHACLFGHAFTERRKILRQQPSLLWTNQLLTECWGHGMVSVGELNFTTAQYTAAYVTKKLHSKQQYVRLDEETGELVPLVQPRAFMSLRPAIGRTWLEQYGDAVYAHDHVIVNGRPQKPPKYYDQWLKQRSEIALQMIQDKRKEGTKPKTQEQNRARARNAHARAKQRAKKL